MTATGLPPGTPVPEAVPAPLLSPALAPRVLFPAARACYGAMLLCAPGVAAGAGIDGCHAASMLAMAAASPRMRRAGLTDALAAAAFTATGAVMATAAGPPP